MNTIIATALNSICPSLWLTIEGSDYNTLVMIDGATKPTKEAFNAEITRLQAEYDSKQYARNRAEAYPSLQEQADMAYWDRQNGTTTLDDAISAVKIQFPKG